MNDAEPLRDLPVTLLVAEIWRRLFHGELDPALATEAEALTARVDEIERRVDVGATL